MKPIKFSIITICFNSAKTIERTIKSVLAQTYSNYEYIIVDGASKDETLEIVNSYKNDFGEKLRIISEPDNGIYNAMNKGIGMANGDIVGIVNSDDWLEPTALDSINKMVNSEKDINNKVYCGSICFHYSDGSVLNFHADKSKFEQGAKSYSLNRGLFHPAMFVPKMLYDRLGGFDERIKVSADVDFIFRCYNAGISFIMKDVLISHMSDGGISNKINLHRFRNDWMIFLKNRGEKGWALYYKLYSRYFVLLIKKYTPIGILKIYRSIKIRD